jgi:hypothetical protein
MQKQRTLAALLSLVHSIWIHERGNRFLSAMIATTGLNQSCTRYCTMITFKNERRYCKPTASNGYAAWWQRVAYLGSRVIRVWTSGQVRATFCPWDTPQKCHFTLGFWKLNFSIMGCSWTKFVDLLKWRTDQQRVGPPLRAFPWFFPPKTFVVPTDGCDQNYFVDFYTNHVEMVQLAGSYFATCTWKLVTLTFQHPKTPKSSLLLAGLTGQATQGDFAWVWGA